MAKLREAKRQREDAETASLRDALAALRDSEERFRAVVNSANEGILVYDRALLVTAGNIAASHYRRRLIPSCERR